MKTAKEVFEKVNGFSLIGDNESITLTKRNIFEAMEEYKNQERICKCKNPKVLGDFNSCADARCDECYGYITPLKP